MNDDERGHLVQELVKKEIKAVAAAYVKAFESDDPRAKYQAASAMLNQCLGHPVRINRMARLRIWIKVKWLSRLWP